MGPYALDTARTLEELTELASAGRFDTAVRSLAESVAAAFPRRDVDDPASRMISHGRPLPASELSGPVGVFGPDGSVLALVEDRAGLARPLVVFAPL